MTLGRRHAMIGDHGAEIPGGADPGFEGVRIADSAWGGRMFDPNTWVATNKQEQLIIAGEPFQRGAQTVGVRNVGPGGSNLQIGPAPTYRVDSFEAGGSTLRFGLFDSSEIPGKVLRSRSVWDPASEASYVYQPGGNNPTVQVPPSDQLWSDGTRGQSSYLDESLLVKQGPDADRLIGGFLVKWGPWIKATDITASGWNIHPTPAAGGSSSMTMFHNSSGRLQIVRRNQSGGHNGPVVDSDIVNISTPADIWTGFVLEMKTKLAADGFIRVWRRVDGDTGWSLEGEYVGPWGRDMSDQPAWWAMNHYKAWSYYQFHNWGNDIDTRYAPVREVEFGGSWCGVDNASAISPVDMQAHVDYFMPGGGFRQ